MLQAIPYMAVLVIVYNALVFLTGIELSAVVTEVTLVSGAVWTLTVSDILLVSGLALLLVEIISATRVGGSAIINHSLSVLVFVVCLLQFVALPQFGTSTFFFITLYTLIDVVAGFVVTIPGF